MKQIAVYNSGVTNQIMPIYQTPNGVGVVLLDGILTERPDLETMLADLIEADKYVIDVGNQ